ncbi:MAG: HAMP domain-containing sensor histidine kinase [Pseudomonadota bacterium]
MTAKAGLRRRLSREFFLQAVYISIAAVLGIAVVAVLVDSVVTRAALQGEADYYRERLREDPAAELPNTRNMIGYRSGTPDGVPPALSQLPNGLHSLDDHPEFGLVHVSSLGDERLYLAFDNRGVYELIAAFGLLPLALVLIVIYVSLYLAYRVSRRAVSPVIALADNVRRLDPSEPDPALFDSGDGDDEEVAVLASALGEFAQRLGDFAERERTFTRDASHELRSPLTVIRMAAEGLLASVGDDDPARAKLVRIRSASEDMEELIHAFLLLARQDETGFADEWASVNDVLAGELERTRVLIGDKPVTLSIDAAETLLVAAPERVLASITGNLLRNAALYTEEGAVTVTIGGGAVAIADTGPGIAAADLDKIFQPFYRAEAGSGRRGGHGVGLTIVQRLTERFGWPLDIDSEPGAGTTVTIRFPDATIRPISQDLHAG